MVNPQAGIQSSKSRAKRVSKQRRLNLNVGQMGYFNIRRKGARALQLS